MWNQIPEIRNLLKRRALIPYPSSFEKNRPKPKIRPKTYTEVLQIYSTEILQQEIDRRKSNLAPTTAKKKG